MSTGSQSRRGRQVSVKRSSATTLYWIIGALVLLGSAVLVFFAAGGSLFGGSATAGVRSVDWQVGTLSAPLTYKDAQGKDISVAAGMHYAGNADSPVKVIEYADFQCPACASFAKTSEAGIFNDYVKTNKIQFVYHEFPLTQHANAEKAAEAARCAGDQNKFWEMHDMLYTKQNEWADDGNPVTRYVGYAGNLGLNTGDFESCVNGGKYTPQVKAAADASAGAQIPATPTFVVNGKQVPGTGLKAAIDAALRGQ